MKQGRQGIIPFTGEKKKEREKERKREREMYEVCEFLFTDTMLNGDVSSDAHIQVILVCRCKSCS